MDNKSRDDLHIVLFWKLFDQLFLIVQQYAPWLKLINIKTNHQYMVRKYEFLLKNSHMKGKLLIVSTNSTCFIRINIKVQKFQKIYKSVFRIPTVWCLLYELWPTFTKIYYTDIISQLQV